MTDAEITRLLTKRNRLLTRRDGLYDHKIIDRIDAKLSTVAPGVNNEVDKALGRLCAVLERFAPRPGWFVNQAVTLEQDGTKQLIEMTQRAWNEAEPIEY